MIDSITEEINQILKITQFNANDRDWWKVENGSRRIWEKCEIYLSEGILKHWNDKFMSPNHT